MPGFRLARSVQRAWGAILVILAAQPGLAAPPQDTLSALSIQDYPTDADSSPAAREFRARDHSRLELEKTAQSNLFSLPLIGRIRDAGVRVSTSAGSRFDGLTQQALFLDFGLPWAWDGRRGLTAEPFVSLEVGRFSRDSEEREFLSLGPTLRFSNDNWPSRMFVDVGISPTVIGAARYGDEDLGSSFNFSSHVGLGIRFGKNDRQFVKFRYQHISNGGLDPVNPGVNLVGLDFVVRIR